MKDCFYIFLISIILINILFFINCTDTTNQIDSTNNLNNLNDSTASYINCKKLIIDKNGKLSIDNIKEENRYNNTIKSIKFNESFIIYDCWNETEIDNQNSCKYNSSENNSNENLTESTISDDPQKYEDGSIDCSKKEAKGDKDNICCHYRVKSENKLNNAGCLEINKYEFQRFKWAFSDYQYDNVRYINDTILEIECNDKINKINKFYILLFLIIFIIL